MDRSWWRSRLATGIRRPSAATPAATASPKEPRSGASSISNGRRDPPSRRERQRNPGLDDGQQSPPARNSADRGGPRRARLRGHGRGKGLRESSIAHRLTHPLPGPRRRPTKSVHVVHRAGESDGRARRLLPREPSVQLTMSAFVCTAYAFSGVPRTERRTQSNASFSSRASRTTNANGLSEGGRHLAEASLAHPSTQSRPARGFAGSEFGHRHAVGRRRRARRGCDLERTPGEPAGRFSPDSRRRSGWVAGVRRPRSLRRRRRPSRRRSKRSPLCRRDRAEPSIDVTHRGGALISRSWDARRSIRAPTRSASALLSSPMRESERSAP